MVHETNHSSGNLFTKIKQKGRLHHLSLLLSSKVVALATPEDDNGEDEEYADGGWG